MTIHDAAHVYFAIGEKNGRGVIKLGASSNVEKRIKSLSAYVDGDIRLLAVLPLAARAKERLLHARFERFRLPSMTVGPTSEWYDADPEIIAYAKRHGLTRHEAMTDGADALSREAVQLRKEAYALRQKARDMDASAVVIEQQAKVLRDSWSNIKDQLTAEVAP